MTDATGLGFEDVTRTRWSMVRQLQATGAADAREALAALAVRYWYPVYAYVRRSGHPPEIAQDIVQRFFEQLGAEARGGSDPPTGRFREWLLARLNAFLAADWRIADTATEPLSAVPPLGELEGRHHAETAADASPEQAYQRSYALEVLARGFKALQAEACETGRIDMYEALEPYLARDPLPGQYEEIAGRLHLRPLVLVLALKRLRQRFRELVHQELVDTTTSPAETEAEQQRLYAALVRSGGP